MIGPTQWTWQTWAILAMALAIVAGQVRPSIRTIQDRAVMRATLALPETADFWSVSYVSLERDANGRLVVFTDAHAEQTFEGRFRVALRDRETKRHAFTPEWSDWIEYKANDGARYRQPETFQWWANRTEFFEPPPNAWAMETCWQARIEDDLLGLVPLEPVCITSQLDRLEPQSIENEVAP